MKKTLLLLVIAFLPFWSVMGQMSILLVDDSKDNFNHVEDFSAAMDSLGYAHTIYDAAGTQSVPDLNTLTPYDLVIWHAGSESDSLAFWNRLDTTNQDLESYLAGGGRLWVIGTDLLYDRYGSAPVNFSSGSMEFDYMGIVSYDLQTYVDDGGIGLPLADPAAASPIAGLPQLDWIFSTLWYVDGVTPISGGGLPVYEMGDVSYVNAGHACGVWFDNGTSQVLSFFFNISQVSTFDKMKDATAAVLGFFQSQVVATDPSLANPWKAVLAPNPTRESLGLQVEIPVASKGSIRVFNALGVEMLSEEIAWTAGLNQLVWSVQDWKAGLYFVQIAVAGQVQTLSMTKQ